MGKMGGGGFMGPPITLLKGTLLKTPSSNTRKVNLKRISFRDLIILLGSGLTAKNYGNAVIVNVTAGTALFRS
jgi:hypothetical protein